MQAIPGYQLAGGDMNMKQFPTSYLLMAMVGTDGTLECFNNTKVPKNEMMIGKRTGNLIDHCHGVMWLSISTDDERPDYYHPHRTDNSLTQQYFGVNESGEAMAGGEISIQQVTICRHRWLYQSFFPHDFPKPTIEH